MHKCAFAIFCDVCYSSDFYDETINVRSFGRANLWASIGGYVGMILGLSFFQVPDIVFGIFHYIKKKRMCTSEAQPISTETEVNEA